jgi:TRAP-type C4-dicarboxylate transport system permease large subunit
MIYFLTFGFIIALLVGIPVAFSLGIAGMLGYLSSASTVSISIVSQKMLSSLNNFILLSVPLFILAAKLMNTSGITKKIFSFANTIVGFMPGGLGHANVVASLIFAGMSGAAIADVAGLGQIELKAMEEEGYDIDFSVAITAASSTIGPIFPPSIPMLVYAMVSGASVGKLFLGGVVPGLLMTVILMAMVWVYAVKRNYPRKPFPSLRIIWDGCSSAVLPLLTPVILLILNVFLLIIGCFLDSTVAILIVTPILVPVINQLGIDLVHFGVVMVLNLMLGLLTPPFGVVLFVIQHYSKLPFGRVVKAVTPFLIPLAVVLILITVFPRIVMWLPNLLFK